MKVNSGRLVAAVVICVLAGWLACGAQQAASRGDAPMIHIPPPAQAVPLDFSQYFQYQPLRQVYHALEYGLPLRKADIKGYPEMVAELGLSPEAENALLNSGFVVTGFGLCKDCDDVVEAYQEISRRDLPVFVTSGSLLHVYHVLFDEILSSVEARHLYDDIWNLSLALFKESYGIYQAGEGDVAEAARRNAVFLAVGLSLLRPEPDQIPPLEESRPRMMQPKATNDFEPGDLDRYGFEVPGDIADAVARELDLIAGHGGFSPSPLFIYNEDYSQYVPRGHYTSTQKLRNYFRALMWYGRMSMLLKGNRELEPGQTCRPCDALISDYDARIQTLGAVIMAAAMGNDPRLMEWWGRAYRVTCFFVGLSDDLGPYQYLEAMNQVFAQGNLGSFTEEAYGRLKAKLAEYRSPLIYGGTGDCMILPPFTPQQADQCLDKTRGFRLMGQRFVPDSYIMSKMVAPYTGEFRGGDLPFTAFAIPGLGIHRVFPRGLDVMAILGSVRARMIVDELGDSNYETFEEAFANIKAEVDAIDEKDWNQNLYWNWLWTLRGLLSAYGEGRPTFMQSQAWKDRLLTVALSSWAQLRHDTILYVKQSYTMALGAAPPAAERGGFVEPVPEFYNRLLSLTRMMRLGLEAMDLLDGGMGRRLSRFESEMEGLRDISLLELKGEALTPEQSESLGRFGDLLDAMLGDIGEESLKTTMAADVHTDANSGQVLEEATGYVDLIVVAWIDAGGIRLAAGPELSYYEFKQPLDERLTDEAWREMLATRPPPRPSWSPLR